jgi:drug/metabolite transporter (DMT)-like permease
MTLQTLILILIAVSFSAVAQLLFKLGLTASAPPAGTAPGPVDWLIASLMNPGVLGGLVLYGVGTVVWLAALSRVDVSQAYPFVGLGFVLTAVLGHLLLGEAISPQRAAGILLVIGGIALIART